jgi:polysaccharide export outer membrane protein
MKICLSAILGVALVSSCGAQFVGTAAGTISPNADHESLLQSLVHAPRCELLFRVDDVLSAQLYGVKDYDIEQRVASDGTIAFPLVGKVQVAGLTVQQLESRLDALLADGGMIRNPQITIRAVARPSAVVTVSGDVAKPGIFPAYGDLTVMDYLSEAGGLVENLTSTAATNSPASSVVTLIRPALEKPVSIPLGPDPTQSPYARIPIFPGDEIRAGRTGVVYAVGAFKVQGAYPLKSTSPTTVLQLVALAGGIGYEADRKDATILRIRDRSRYVVNVNVSQILKGKTADVALQTDDIVFVPTNNLKAAIKGGGSGVVVSLASAYVYSHP